eukprot:5750240-Amphidinium_carterae.1
MDGVRVSQLPSKPASAEGFCLAIGSEAHGVSQEVRAGSTLVAMPMSELVDSLNAGVAGGILMHALASRWG